MAFTETQKYDTLIGRPVREMRPNDIFLISTSGTTGCIGSTFAGLTGTITSSQELYITNIWFITEGTMDISVQGNTSTILSFYNAPLTPVSIQTDLDHPIAKVTGASTISIRSEYDGATACGWLSGVRFPIWSKVETA